MLSRYLCRALFIIFYDMLFVELLFKQFEEITEVYLYIIVSIIKISLNF